MRKMPGLVLCYSVRFPGKCDFELKSSGRISQSGRRSGRAKPRGTLGARIFKDLLDLLLTRNELSYPERTGHIRVQHVEEHVRFSSWLPFPYGIGITGKDNYPIRPTIAYERPQTRSCSSCLTESPTGQIPCSAAQPR